MSNKKRFRELTETEIQDLLSVIDQLPADTDIAWYVLIKWVDGEQILNYHALIDLLKDKAKQ